MTHAKRHLIVNVALAALAIALTGIVVATAGSVTTSEREAREFNLLAAWRDDEVRSVRISQGNETIRLQRIREGEGEGEGDEGTWHIKAPYDEEADPFGVDSYLGTLQYASWQRRIKPEEVDRKAFGLDDPRLVVEVEMGDITYRLRLGNEAASPEGSAYLEITGEGAPRKGIVIVGKSLIDELAVEVEQFRGRYVMPYLSPILEEIVLEGAGGKRRLVRAAWNNGWRFEGMMNGARAGRAALDRLLVQFAKTLDEFVDPKKAEAASADAESGVTVTLHPRDEKMKKGVVRIGGSCPTNDSDVIALRTEPDRLAGCVPRIVLGGLSMPAEALVDRSLFWMRRDEVESVSIVEGGKKLAMDRKEEGFILRSPKEAPVDAEAGNARLDSLLGATGTIVETPDLAKLGLDEPLGTATVKSAAAHESEVQTETVAFSAPAADGRVFARREHDGIVLELAREAARALRPDASLVRSRNIFDYPLDSVQRLEIDGDPKQVLVRGGEGSITLEEPADFGADAALATEAMDAVRTLTADRWVSDEDDGTFGLEEPLLRAHLTVRKKDGSDAEHEVVIGRPAPSGYYATIRGDSGVFVVPRRVYEVLTTLTLDRSLFMVDPAETAAIELTTPERRFRFEKQGGELVQTGGDEMLPPAAIQRIADALSAMRPEAAISLGPPLREHGLDRPLLVVKVEPDPGASPASKTVVWRVGAGDSWRGISVHYARVDGTDATFVLPRSLVQQVIDSV